ncbi:protein IWS1 homolog [Pollicipes pollicipes]|uniref:protein IWS1 homolog n=1 Tax=Pollicipes pollicipes TaxID=41117 RepID=UPI00188498BF|nr:protein IWS1 homolog [Pollicipes pollicipes]
MIFCTRCPAAFHKTCHDPAVLLRVRPGWECMDCKGAPKKRRGRGASQPLPSALLRAARAGSGDSHDEDEEAAHEEDGAEGEGEEEPAVAEEAAREEDDAEEEEAAPRARARRSAGRSRPAGRAARRRPLFSSESEDERHIRQLSSDEESWAPRARRSSASRRTEVRHRCRRQPRKTYQEREESDLEPSAPGSPTGAAAAPDTPEPPARPSPSKVELIQQAGAVCMYCDQPRTRRNELAVCQSCSNLYHRRCAARAGLVDAWQCSVCVMPAVHRSRPVKPPVSEDFEYDE